MPCFGGDWLGFARTCRAAFKPLPSGEFLKPHSLRACWRPAWSSGTLIVGPRPRICVFPDAEYYWALAGTIREGTLYEIVEWGDIPHFALRTPGYPVFLAACRTLLGEHPMGVRLVQAGLGVVTVWLVYQLTREVTGEQDHEACRSG